MPQATIAGFIEFKVDPTSRGLNVRKLRRDRKKSEAANGLKFLTRKIVDLENRITAIERSTQFQLPGPPPRRRGPRPGVRKDDLLGCRDTLVEVFEENWPELHLALRKAKKPADLLQPLKRLQRRASNLYQPPFLDTPEEYLDDLWAFLHTGRYRENPRNLAAAMAGVHGVSWKRSFDLGSSNPSNLPLARRAYREFLRRKFPHRLRELLQAENEIEVADILARSRTKDRHYRVLRINPDQVLGWLREGLPQTSAQCRT